jgi:hypothetical protein
LLASIACAFDAEIAHLLAARFVQARAGLSAVSPVIAAAAE